MSEIWIKVGQAFRATCDIRVDGVAALDMTAGSAVVINYRRPDGTTGTLTPDILGAYTASALVTATLNPKAVTTGDPKWKNGYPGSWEFFPSGLDASGDPFEAKGDFVHVHSKFRNVT